MNSTTNRRKWSPQTPAEPRHMKYQAYTSPEQKQMQEDSYLFKMIEEACRNSKYLDYTIFDELYSDTSPKAFYLKNYLKSIERLATHWKLVREEDYKYRAKNYDNIDEFINEIPRVINGRYFSIKTFLLSLRRLQLSLDFGNPKYKKTESYKTCKLFYKECAKLHLEFHRLLDFFHLLAKYLNKIRQAKKRQYEDVEGLKIKELSEKKAAWMTNLFANDPQHKSSQEKQRSKDTKLLKFYEESQQKIRNFIKNLNLIPVEKTYISVIVKLNQQFLQEQSEILETKIGDQRKIIENQFFDEDGNFFNSMMKSFASGISSIKGSPIDADKCIGLPNNKPSPYLDLVVRTPADKKKLYGNFKQTSSSLLRKAQAMNKPIHSNRKLFSDNEKDVKMKGVPQAVVSLNDKENNCDNTPKNKAVVSPIPSVKGTWGKFNSPSASGLATKVGSPSTAYYKSPFVVNSNHPNAKTSSQVTTPMNGLKGSLVATSTCGSTIQNIKSRNYNLEELGGTNQGESNQKGTFKSICLKSNAQSPTASGYKA
ncbi:unnamed protein product [Moneuplotes crassus]|uniref:Uncharacterized protein n=1 Tax=Euplotes crassus TaxID=5936 RepID=A0AAD1U9L6_EUPCR|nr:unnamed protein product [Moneuplotes crassus]